MNCRVCQREIGESKYCYHCGWLNGEVRVAANSLSALCGELNNTFIELKNDYFSDVFVEISIKDEEHIVNSTLDKTNVRGNDSAEIPIIIDLKNYSNYDKNITFTLYFKSYDGKPLKPDVLRPYALPQYREWSELITIDVRKPGILNVEIEMLLFDSKHTKRSLNIFNEGDSAIILDKENFNMPQEFELEFEGSDDKIIIEKKASANLNINLIKTEAVILKEMSFFYMVGSEKIGHKIQLFYHETDNENFKPLYENIVSVDFGTSKTVCSYLNLLSYAEGEDLNDEVRMLILEDGEKVKRTEMPSSMAYDGRVTHLGTLANKYKKAPDIEYVSCIKMHLDNEMIDMRFNNSSKKRPTREVLTTFLSYIKQKISEQINMDDNVYVFTLPVLDGRDGEKYLAQKKMTLSCAQESGFDFEENIITVTEPEAAMYYILNNAKEHPENFKELKLQNDDEICVFDYGGGTLDICIGKYMLKDGKPTIVDAISIGLYNDDDDNEISLGGDRLDRLMAYAVYENCKEAEFTDKSLTLADFENQSVQQDEDLVLIRDLLDETKNNKEELSKNWKTVDSGIPYSRFSNDDVTLSKETFEKIVNVDVSYAISKLKAIIKTNDLKIKYMFMIGGSSLIEKIKPQLSAAFPHTKIYNAYDYAVKGDTTDAYQCAYSESVYAVARGAALSYLTSFNDSLSFYIKIAPANDINSKFSITYQKGENVYPKKRIIPASLCKKDWSIWGSSDDKNYYILKSFSGYDGTLTKQNVLLSTAIASEQIKISVSIGETKYKLADLGLYV